VILTSAPRSGGEVRITEAERPRHVYPGRTGYTTGIAVRSGHTRGSGTRRLACGECLGTVAKRNRTALKFSTEPHGSLNAQSNSPRA
jgi:hypothetical protein